MQIKRMIRLLPFLAVLGAFPLVFGEAPFASEGVLDLRNADFHRPYTLDGEWEFRELGHSGYLPTTIQVPGDWSDITGTPYAAGEYRLTVRLPDQVPPHFTLLLPEYDQVAQLLINDAAVFESGSWADSKTDFTRFKVPLEQGGDILLTIRLKNTIYRKGGLFRSILIGKHNVISRYVDSRLIIESAIMGVLLSVAFFQFFLYFSRNFCNSSLFLGSTSLFMAIRGCFSGEILALYLFPRLNWYLSYRMDYGMIYLVAIMISLFSRSVFPRSRRWLSRGIEGICVVGIVLFLLSLFLPMRLLSKSVYILQGYILLVFIVNLVFYLLAVAERDKGAFFFLIGGAAFFVFSLLDIASYYGIVNVRNASLIGMVLFVAFQGMSLARQYREVSLRAEIMAYSLETKVAQRTLELESSNHTLKKEIQYRKRMEALLRELSMTDPLTGIHNRLLINEELNKVHQIAIRYGTPYGIIMFDVDYFKKINDRYGHSEGDRVLKELAVVTQEQIRESDIFSRWGGEEFLILLPQIALKGAVEAAERIRISLEQADILENERVTASFGVVAFSGGSVSLNQLLNKVDQLLYSAKRQGRNQVVS